MVHRVLMVHNYYGTSAPSGENVMVDAETRLLQTRGVTVDRYHRHSDEVRGQGLLGAIKAAPVIPWNIKSYREIRQRLTAQPVDIMHVHNAFPLISPSVFYAARGLTTRVLTVHNYRLFCAAGIPLRDGSNCTECLDQRSSWPALKYGCYRGSRLATLPLAASIALHRRLNTWQQEVDAFIALSEYQKQLMVGAGLPAHKVYVKSNFVTEPADIIDWDARESYVIYVGRLGAEKGLRTLMAAWQAWGEAAPQLRIIGDGPLRAELETSAGTGPVRFYGQLDREAVDQQLSRARLLVLPSECIEGVPLSLLEASARATPALVSDAGPLPGLVGAGGVTFASGDAAALLTALKALWQNSTRLQALSENARRVYTQYHSEQHNAEALMAIYQAARSQRESGPRQP